jgi:hypothetical protein
MSISRLLSLVVAGIYLLVPLFAYVGGDQEALKGFLYMLAFLMLPLGCIWFGDELGGLIGIKYGLVSSPSPGWAVALLGWILLFMPVVVVIIMAIVK